VVGVTADVRQNSPDVPVRNQIFQPYSQNVASYGSLAPPDSLNGQGGTIALRTSLLPEQMIDALGATVRQIDPQLPLTQVQSMDQAITATEAPRRFSAALISAFAAAALLLAFLGIYSVIAFSTAMRTQEMAIRLALGSKRSGVIALVLASGAKLATAGCALGLIGAVAASRLIQSMVYGVKSWDPLTLVLAAALVVLLALAASLLPACRAASTNPVEALRGE
jgi:ABC-type antimicrobial peptide transport system permease subunit